ncbi:hypothetical protein G6F56_008922 [Rhizopus delemar]|nr:hypothetical protein G6F56_008922 [Rhizopus delemar]
MTNTFYFEDGMDNLFDEHGERVYDPMEGVLTEITDPNIVLETITNRKSYLANKPAEKNIVVKEAKETKALDDKSAKSAVYNTYTDKQREDFIDKMIENPEEKGNITKFAKEFLINPRTAERWWKIYQKTGEVPYKKSKNNRGPKSSFTEEHKDFIKILLDDDPQLVADDIIEELTKQFEDFSISKPQLNHHLRNTMQITIKKPHFEAEARNSVANLQTRYEWFMDWKEKDLDYTNNCVFIDEAGFHINMRNNWARSPAGTRAVVKTAKTRVTSHSVIGAIHSSAVLHVVLKKPPPKPEKNTAAKKKRKGNSGKKRGVAETNDDEGNHEDDTSPVDIKPAPKGTTTAHFIKFVNELLDIMDEDESLKGSYLVMDNASIHKSKSMIRKIEARGYTVMYLPP